MNNENVIPCYICKKVWKRKDAGKWVYYDGKYHDKIERVCCIDHPGVKEWYEQMIKDVEKKMGESNEAV